MPLVRSTGRERALAARAQNSPRKRAHALWEAFGHQVAHQPILPLSDKLLTHFRPSRAAASRFRLSLESR